MKQSNKKKIILTPKNDIIFKAIFGDQKRINILAAFLRAVFEKSPIKIEFKNLIIGDTTLKPDNAKERRGIVDVLAITDDGKTIDVEIQIADLNDMTNRTVYYGAKMITTQVTKKVKLEDRYKNIKPAIVIAITDFKMFEKIDDYFNAHAVCNLVYHNIYCDVLQIYTLELPKLPAKDDDSKLWTWLKFIRAKSKKQMQILSNKIPEVDEAMAVYNDFMTKDRLRELAEAHEIMAKMDENERIAMAEEKALKKGLKKGLKEGKKEGLKEGLKEGKKEGLKEGEANAKIGLAVKLIKTGKMSIDEAIAFTGLDKSYEKKIKGLLNKD